MVLHFGTSVLLMQSQYRNSRHGVGTATQKLASHLLGQDVHAFIAERRAGGRAWRYIARDLYEATNGQVDVTYETLRQWHDEVAA